MEKHYPSDLTDKQWAIIEPLLPAAKPGGRPRCTELRAVMDALLYIDRTGCQWRYLPEKYPPRSTVFEYFTQWRQDGTWDIKKIKGRKRHIGVDVLVLLICVIVQSANISDRKAA